MAAFDCLACIQFDPLNVVGRNPDLVLQGRVNDYRPEMLYELIYGERQLYDYWDKMVSIVPLRDWPQLALLRAAWCKRHAECRAQHAEHIETILEVIRQQGPMSSLDFKAQREPGQSLTDELADALRDALAHLLAYLGVAGCVAAEEVDPAVSALVERVG